MTDDDLNWLVEEACLNAWPSPRQMMLGGFLLRAAGGRVRRANSLYPLRGGPRDPSPIIDAVVTIYRGLGLAPLFRVPTLVPAMDAPLAQRGYGAEGETSTLLADLQAHRPEMRDGVEITTEPTEEWRAARAAFNDVFDPGAVVYRAMVELIALPKAFAARRADGKLVAIAFGVVHQGVMIAESVATHPEHRQRGYGRAIMGALLDWAQAHGAWGAALQVQSDNAAGLALYRSLGYTRELYRYHYRRVPAV